MVIMNIFGLILYFVLTSDFIIQQVNGKTEIYIERATWRTASTKYISKGGALAEKYNVLCSDLQNNSMNIWIGGYQTFVWLKTIGCDEINSENMTRWPAIEKCIIYCNSEYIGFLSGRCYCYDERPKILTPIDLKTFTGDNNNCVIIQCVNNTELLTEANCGNQFPALCDGKSRSDINNISTQLSKEMECKAISSLVKSENVCTTTNYKIAGLWTNIRRYRLNHTATEPDMNKTTIIRGCMHGTCIKNGQTLSAERGNCDENYNGYACKLKDATTEKNSKTKNVRETTTEQLHISKHVGNEVATQIQNITIVLKPTPRPSFTETAKYTERTQEIESTIETEIVVNTDVSMAFELGLSTINYGESDNSMDGNKGLIAGISVALVCFCILVIGVGVYFRRHTLHKDTTSLTQVNTPSENNEMNEVAEICDQSPDIIYSLEPRHEVLSVQEYAIVIKKIPTENKVNDEDEYNRLDWLMKTVHETTNGNVYDTMLGARERDDPTYNTAMHNSTSNDCQYDASNMYNS